MEGRCERCHCEKCVAYAVRKAEETRARTEEIAADREFRHLLFVAHGQGIMPLQDLRKAYGISKQKALDGMAAGTIVFSGELRNELTAETVQLFKCDPVAFPERKPFPVLTPPQFKQLVGALWLLLALDKPPTKKSLLAKHGDFGVSQNAMHRALYRAGLWVEDFDLGGGERLDQSAEWP